MINKVSMVDNYLNSKRYQYLIYLKNKKKKKSEFQDVLQKTIITDQYIHQ